MKISIVVDNYNYERFIAAAIESALAQTWADVEVLVVDDGSTDDSRSIIESYGDRITPIYKTNGGQASAFNLAFGQVTGDAVLFLDADDVLRADVAEKIARAMNEDPALARVQWPMQTIDDEGKPKGRVVPEPSMMPSGDLREHILRYRTHVWPAQSGNAYATWVLRRVLPIEDDFRMGSDLYLAEATALFGPIKSLPEIGGYYRVHGSNHWTRETPSAEYFHQKINWTLASHERTRKFSAELGLDCPERATTALDVAFACQRLASLRIDPARHPIADDRRLPLLVHAIRSTLAHPQHTKLHKLKRLAWIVGMTLGNDKVADRLIRRFYFRP